jgi:hypothetical protein
MRRRDWGNHMHHEKALALSASASVQPADFAGTWKNELKSTMDIRVADGKVTGIYKSKVSGSGDGITGDITGSVTGHVITFFVNWGNGSITTWIGHLVEEYDVPAIETMWLLGMTTPNPDNPEELWESILTGNDRFYRP